MFIGDIQGVCISMIGGAFVFFFGSRRKSKSFSGQVISEQHLFEWFVSLTSSVYRLTTNQTNIRHVLVHERIELAMTCAFAQFGAFDAVPL